MGEGNGLWSRERGGGGKGRRGYSTIAMFCLFKKRDLFFRLCVKLIGDLSLSTSACSSPLSGVFFTYRTRPFKNSPFIPNLEFLPYFRMMTMRTQPVRATPAIPTTTYTWETKTTSAGPVITRRERSTGRSAKVGSSYRNAVIQRRERRVWKQQSSS